MRFRQSAGPEIRTGSWVSEADTLEQTCKVISDVIISPWQNIHNVFVLTLMAIWNSGSRAEGKVPMPPMMGGAIGSGWELVVGTR
mgnify:CR=1 FL=1